MVSLEVPESFALLKEQMYGYIPFAISFFALVMIWKIHYNLFRRIRHMDNWIIALNMFMVFTLLYFVYPLKFLTNLAFGMDKEVSLAEFSQLFQLYSFGFLMLFTAVSLLYWHSAKLEPEPQHRTMLAFYARHFAIFVFMSIVSILLARFQLGLRWGLPGMIYALLGPLCWYHGRR